MTESLAEGRTEAAHILRLCLRRAEQRDSTDSFAAGVLRQSIGRIYAKGYLNDRRGQALAETTPKEVTAVLARLDAIARSGGNP